MYFIKSGLSYFYYIITILLLTFVLLGRSKSEQYFGFLPFFSYINFFLGYLPLVFSDITSQIIILFYALYTFFYKTMYFLLNKITSNTVNLVTSDRDLFTNSFTIDKNLKENSNFTTMFNVSTNFNIEKYKLPLISKSLSKVRNDISSTNVFHKDTTSILTNNFSVYELVLKLKKPLNVNKFNFNSISNSESSYSGVYSNKVHSISLTLNDLTSFYKIHNYPSVFNFNVKDNLNIASQQR
jgi:hypothetical protein